MIGLVVGLALLAALAWLWIKAAEVEARKDKP
jgi:hypothetical protein